VPADKRAGARLVARASQHAEVASDAASEQPLRHRAIDLLRGYAGERDVVSVCCIGCGAHHRKLMQCANCHIARFCGPECVRLMWPTHKGSCQAWQREQAEATESSE
jgi:hypothetical protein